MKTACVLLADGFEEVEALTPVDYLRRAGIETTVIGLGPEPVGGHGIKVKADRGADALADTYDCVVIPGGGLGAERISADTRATATIKRHFDSGKLVAAICAAPAVVLHGACRLLGGRRFTCYPGLETKVTGATFIEERVVVDGNLITARGPGCAGEFAYAIVNALVGEEAADLLAEKTLL